MNYGCFTRPGPEASEKRGPLAGPATALPRTNAGAWVTLAGVRIPPRD